MRMSDKRVQCPKMLQSQVCHKQIHENYAYADKMAATTHLEKFLSTEHGKLPLPVLGPLRLL